MQLLHEHLARAHYQAVTAEAHRAARARRYAVAARAQQHAERTALRARRLLVLAVAR